MIVGKKTVRGFSILIGEVISDYPVGGDSSLTTIKIMNGGGATIKLLTDDTLKSIDSGESFTLILKGDDEVERFVELMEWVINLFKKAKK